MMKVVLSVRRVRTFIIKSIIVICHTPWC